MTEFIEIANTIGILGTILISCITLFTTRALQRSQQKATVMATKRSERIDLMREYSAGILSCGKHILYGLEEASTKRELICYVDKFNSLLQYAYQHDVDLIDNTNRILACCVSQPVDKAVLQQELQTFWQQCDNYVGVEHERLKTESMGNINGSGQLKREDQTFEDIHQLISQQQRRFLK